MVKQVDVERYNALLAAGKRTEAYVEYAEDLLSNGEFGGYHQVMMMAQISSYSGDVGGAAILGNLVASKHEDYNLSLDDFSRDVAERLFEAVRIDVSDTTSEGQGLFNAAEVRALAYSAWADKGLGGEFPGNFQRTLDENNDYANVEFGTDVMERIFQNDPQAYQGDEFSILGSGLFTQGWIRNAGVGIAVDVIGHQLGNHPEEYGFTQEQITSVGNGGDSATLPNGLTMAYSEVQGPNGEAYDSYAAIYDPSGKMINIINEFNDDYFRTGGRFIDGDDPAAAGRFGTGDRVLTETLSGFVGVTNNTQGARRDTAAYGNHIYPDGWPEHLRTYEAQEDDLREFQGDLLKNYLGADMGEYGVRQEGTPIYPFRGLEDPDAPRDPSEGRSSMIHTDEVIQPYDLESAVVTESSQATYTLEESLIILRDESPGVLTDLRLQAQSGDISEADETLLDVFETELPEKLMKELVVNEVAEIDVSGRSLETPIDRVRAVTIGVFEVAREHDIELPTAEVSAGHDIDSHQIDPVPYQQDELDYLAEP